MELVDHDRRRVAVNDSACLLLGRPREAVLGTRLEDFVAPEFLPEAEGTWRAFLQRGTWLGESAIVRPDRRFVRVEFAAVLTEIDGEPRTLIVTLEHRTVEDEEPEPSQHGQLTPRETEIVNYVAMGKSGPDIAEILFISPATVRTHVRNAMGKLGARTRAHLVAIVLTDRGVLAESHTNVRDR
jgi:DNA-binding CsgD family transcriptional regulator